MKSPKDIYLITRVHGLKQHLLGSEDIIGAARRRNLAEMLDVLMRSDYSSELSRIPMKELDAYQLERIFYQKLSERFTFLLKTTSGRDREAFEEYYQRIEVENLNKIIRAAHGKERIAEEELIPVPRRYRNISYSALRETSTVEHIISLLKETPYRDLAKVADLYEKYQNPLVFESQAHKIYYRILWEKIENITNRNEVKKLVGIEVDLKNLLHLLSFKKMGMPRELLREMIIDVHYELSDKVVSKLLEEPYDRIPNVLTWPPYKELAEKALELLDEGMQTPLENVFLRYLYSYAAEVMHRNPNDLAYVFAYLLLCIRETRNLTTIAIGKQLNLSQDRIRNSLFL